MRMKRIGAVAASAALASITVLGGAGTAMAQETDTATVTSEGNYTMTATAIGDCQVEFTLKSLRGDDYGNWRGDFQVNEEDPITAPGSNPGVGNRGETFRPVIGSHQGIADAIADRENPYDFGAGTVTVDLTAERTVPDFDEPTETMTLPGVEANADGTHTVNFGVYQGPPRYDAEIYNTNGQITVTGCPTTEDDWFGGNLSAEIFGELENLS